MLRQVRTILFNASMVATDKLPAIITPHLCRKYDLTRPDQQASGLSQPYAVHRILAVADFNHLWKCCERIAGKNTAEKIAREIGKVIAAIEDHPFVEVPR
jgi:hypothetical protein